MLWSFVADTSDLSAGEYKICIDADGTAVAQAWADSTLTVTVGDAVSPSTLPAAASQDLTLTSEVDLTASTLYLTSSSCVTTDDGAHTSSIDSGVYYDTDTQSPVGSTPTWIFTLDLTTRFATTYKVCIDTDGVTTSEAFHDTGLRVAVQDAVVDVSVLVLSQIGRGFVSRESFGVEGLVDSVALTPTLSARLTGPSPGATIYLTSGVCAVAAGILPSDGKHLAIRGTDTRAMVVDGSSDIHVLTSDVAGLNSGMYKMCLDMDGPGAAAGWDPTGFDFDLQVVTPYTVPRSPTVAITIAFPGLSANL